MWFSADEVLDHGNGSGGSAAGFETRLCQVTMTLRSTEESGASELSPQVLSISSGNLSAPAHTFKMYRDERVVGRGCFTALPLSYGPRFTAGGPGWIRTSDLLISSEITLGSSGSSRRLKGQRGP